LPNVYGQHVCVHAKVAPTKTGGLKEVGLSYRGTTICNEAWIDVMPTSRMSPVCVNRCQKCVVNGVDHTDVIAVREKRVVSQEQIDKMRAGRR
jgi:hypothetical protein